MSRRRRKIEDRFDMAAFQQWLQREIEAAGGEDEYFARAAGVSVERWREVRRNPPTAEELGLELLGPADLGFNFDIFENENDFKLDLDQPRRPRRSSRK